MRVIIIGAGASGCFAAANIDASCEVLILEQSLKPLQKVRVSGGGRCNVTHACFEPQQLLNYYPRGKRILKKTLAQFTPRHTIEWFSQKGVDLKTEEDGRMFPTTDNSETIIECLLQELQRKKVTIYFQHQVKAIRKEANEYEVAVANGRIFTCDKLIIASGGYPKVSQYQWIQELYPQVQSPVPSLFTFNIPDKKLHELMGLSVPNAVVKIDGFKTATEGIVLITHWGLSGPAILKMSAFAAQNLAACDYQFTVRINWLNEKQHVLEEKLLQWKEEKKTQKIGTLNPPGMPKRLWQYLLNKCSVDGDTAIDQLPNKQLIQLAVLLAQDVYEAKGKTTFKEEFVTCGGIALPQLEPQTLEHTQHKGLYAIGEALDVDGVTGGFNFQHAWSSAFAVAQHINAQL